MTIHLALMRRAAVVLVGVLVTCASLFVASRDSDAASGHRPAPPQSTTEWISQRRPALP